MEKIEAPAILRTEVRLVLLPVTITDRAGRPVGVSLSQDDFRVLENRQPQAIRVFRHEDTPVSLALVLDHSGSMSYHAEAVEIAALDLVRDSNPSDEVCVVNFGADAMLDSDFTNDQRKLARALHRGAIRGNTQMRDAVQTAIQHLGSSAKRNKKVLLVVTDGADLASSISLRDLVRNSQNQGVMIYAIGLLDHGHGEHTGRSKHELKALAEATGGQAFFPGKPAQIDDAAHLIAREIRSQYTLAYSPADGAIDGGYRSIEVKVSGHFGLVARTRSGYSASPEPGRR